MQLTNVSASQVDSWDRCQRYWYNRSVLKIPTPQTPAQKRGQDIHAAIEAYVKDGLLHSPTTAEWIEHVKIAMPFLPPPKAKDVLIEQKITLPTFDGGPIWIGYIDLLDLRKLPVKIGDHKTIGNFKYMKTADDLAVNTQLMSYAKWVLDFVEEVDEVEVEHIYIGTKVLEVRTVKKLVSRDHVLKIWNRDVQKVKAMSEVAKLEPVTAEVLPPTYSSCGAYGGCPYKDLCKITPIKEMFAMSDVPSEASVILQRLKLKANGAETPAAPPQEAAPIPQPSPPQVVEPAPAPMVVAPAPIATSWEDVMKDDPVGHVRYNSGFAHIKVAPGKIQSVQLTPEEFAKAVAAEEAKVSASNPPPRPVEATPPPPPATLAPQASSSIADRLAAMNGGTVPTAAPVVTPTPPPPVVTQAPPVVVVPPDAPSRESTAEEVNAAVNPPTTEAATKRRGRPAGSVNREKETLGKLIQLVMGENGALFALDEVGVVWMMDTALPTPEWRRLPIPRVE